MKIKKIQINNLLARKDIEWNLNPKVNVLLGKNGVGKSTILLIIRAMLMNKLEVNNSLPFYSSSIHFDNENIKPINYKSNILPKDIIDDPKVKKFIEKLDINFKNVVIEKVLKELQKDKTLDFEVNSEILDKVIEKKLANPLVKYSIHHQLLNKLIKDEKQRQVIDEFYQEELANLTNDESIFKELNVSFISMSQLNALSNFKYKDTNQEIINLLDLELVRELYKYTDNLNETLTRKLIDTINVFFNLVNKEVIAEDNKFVFIDREINKYLTFSQLSNGEQQLVFMLIQVSRNSRLQEKHSIILMDEPEVSLHLEWQEILIKQLTLLHPTAQFIIVTHSPAIIMNGWNDVYIDIDEIAKPSLEVTND